MKIQGHKTDGFKIFIHEEFCKRVYGFRKLSYHPYTG